MKTVILSGGLGTRLQEITTVKPKPMVEIGGRPILWHIMKIYSSQGFNEFLIALGYKGELIKHYFLNYYHLQNNFTVDLGRGKVTVHDGMNSHEKGVEDWIVHLIDTGVETLTGGRLRRLQTWLCHDTFMMTYGDGVADINIRDLVAFHRKHGKLATVTVVRPPARFGSLQFNGNQVTSFIEKPQTGEGWINGGFFVLEPGVLEYIEGDESTFERTPLERLASDGQLVSFKHEGFWQCMDTLRDIQHVENLWQSGKAPWKTW